MVRVMATGPPRTSRQATPPGSVSGGRRPVDRSTRSCRGCHAATRGRAATGHLPHPLPHGLTWAVPTPGAGGVSVLRVPWAGAVTAETGPRTCWGGYTRRDRSAPRTREAARWSHSGLPERRPSAAKHVVPARVAFL